MASAARQSKSRRRCIVVLRADIEKNRQSEAGATKKSGRNGFPLMRAGHGKRKDDEIYKRLRR